MDKKNKGYSNQIQGKMEMLNFGQGSLKVIQKLDLSKATKH